MRWTTRSPRDRRREAAGPAMLAVAWLCMLALLAGSLELHRDAASHLAFPAPAASAATGGDTLYACPAGHGAASHVERPRPVERHDCAACLHRLQTRGGELSAFAVAAADAGTGHAWAGLTPGPAAPVLDRAPSRGPPAT